MLVESASLWSERLWRDADADTRLDSDSKIVRYRYRYRKSLHESPPRHWLQLSNAMRSGRQSGGNSLELSHVWASFTTHSTFVLDARCWMLRGIGTETEHGLGTWGLELEFRPQSAERGESLLLFCFALKCSEVSTWSLTIAKVVYDQKKKRKCILNVRVFFKHLCCGSDT